MELTGKVIDASGDRALVALTDDMDAPPEGVWMENGAGAKVGDEVRVMVPDYAGQGTNGLVYLVPLAGVLGGAAAGRLLSTSEAVTGLIRAVGGRFVGGLLSGMDNMALGGGLLGLVAAMVALSIWINRRKKRAFESARITGVKSE